MKWMLMTGAAAALLLTANAYAQTERGTGHAGGATAPAGAGMGGGAAGGMRSGAEKSEAPGGAPNGSTAGASGVAAQPSAAASGEPKNGSASGEPKNAAATQSERPASAPAAQGGPGNEKAGRPDEKQAGSGAKAGGASANVSAQQRTQLHTSVRDVTVREATNIRITNVRIGVDVPHTIVDYWQPVPASIIAIVPAWSEYRVVRIGSEILVIEPDTFRIVYVFDA